jgi:hypothetical protein
VLKYYVCASRTGCHYHCALLTFRWLCLCSTGVQRVFRFQLWLDLSRFNYNVSAFKMQHITLEDEKLDPLEVKLRCLEEEREEALRSKVSDRHIMWS